MFYSGPRLAQVNFTSPWTNSILQPFNQGGLRVESLRLEVDFYAQFRMQPCRFIRSDILGPLKALIDQFIGVLIPEISCTYASLLVVVHKRRIGFGWQSIMGRSTNTCVYQPTNYPAEICCFSSSGDSNIMPKWVIYGAINLGWIKKAAK